MNLQDYIKQIITERELSVKMTERGISEDDINNFIYESARKKAKNNCACIDNETVANWIVHYVEDAYKEDKEKGNHKEEEPQPKEELPKCERKEEQKPIKPKVYTNAKPKAPEGQEQLTWDTIFGSNNNETK